MESPVGGERTGLLFVSGSLGYLVFFSWTTPRASVPR
jgi:hypothetical protein